MNHAQIDQRLLTIVACAFPPPYTGQAIGSAVALTQLQKVCECVSVDLSAGPLAGRSGLTTKLGRITTVALASMKVRRHAIAASKAGKKVILYFVPSGSLLGQLRDLLMIMSARRYCTRIVAHVRSGNFGMSAGSATGRIIFARLVTIVDSFIFLTPSLAHRVANYVDPDTVSIVPNTIDQEALCPTELVIRRLNEKCSQETRHVVFVSNMIRSKGYLDLLEAVKILVTAGDFPIKCTFAGEWPDTRSRDSFEAQVAEYYLTDRVSILGPVTDRKAIRDLLLSSHALALPSYYPVEAQPRCIIEALNCGVPVVSTRHGGIPEIFEDQEQGVLVESRNPASLAEALRHVLRPQHNKTMGLNARRLFMERYHPAKVEKLLLRAVTELGCE